MRQTIEEIKRQYPDEWLLLSDLVESEDGLHVLAAEVLYHDPDKRTLAYMDKPRLQEYKGKIKTLIFNRVTPRNMRMLVGGRRIPGTFRPAKPAQDMVENTIV
jgi:hypothetical protein